MAPNANSPVLNDRIVFTMASEDKQFLINFEFFPCHVNIARRDGHCAPGKFKLQAVWAARAFRPRQCKEQYDSLTFVQPKYSKRLPHKDAHISQSVTHRLFVQRGVHL